MNRRGFLRTGLATSSATIIGTSMPQHIAAAVSPLPGTKLRTFDITTTVNIAEAQAASQLWLPLFESMKGYQKLIGMSVEGNGLTHVDHDPAYGARVLHARWAQGADALQVTVVQRVSIWGRATGETRITATAAERDFWLRPSNALPTDGIVRETAQSIVGGISDPKAKLRAIYDWVIANTYRNAKVAGCGTGDIAAMLKALRAGGPPVGGKCADINSLMVGLSRAAGFPARDIYGIRVADSEKFKSLGHSGDITKAQHCRAEVYLEKEGWFPVDPADVRKVVLEEKLPVDSPQIKALADQLFGNWEGNWAGYNSATGITLKDAPPARQFSFLMYPESVCHGVMANCVDAAAFSYQIKSAEIMG